MDNQEKELLISIIEDLKTAKTNLSKLINLSILKLDEEIKLDSESIDIGSCENFITNTIFAHNKIDKSIMLCMSSLKLIEK